MPIWTSAAERSFCGRRAENVYLDDASDLYGNYLWSPLPLHEPEPIYWLYITYCSGTYVSIKKTKLELIEPLFQYWKTYGDLFNVRCVELLSKRGPFYERTSLLDRVTFPIHRR